MTASNSNIPGNSVANGLRGFATAPWVVGVAITVGFYALLPFLPIDSATTQRYFCGHWIEYATTGLFFVGMVALLYKSLRVPFERAALQDEVLFGLSLAGSADVVQTVDLIENHLQLTSRRYSSSKLVQRIADVCSYVRARRSADGLDGHLSYLADLAAGRMHSSYALIRTITWAVPILGFLGTVIGITMAIANVTPDQLESSLSEVTAGLAVAFDTTALSLSLSMILVFMTFVVEKSEGQILDRIEDFGVRKLVGFFPESSEPVAPPHPLLAAETQAAQKLLEQSESMIRAQTEMWQSSLEGVRARWSTAFDQQHEQLASTLQQEMAKSVAEHDQQLSAVRSEMMQRYEDIGMRLSKQSAEMQQQMQQQHEKQLGQLEAVWSEICQTLREERYNQQEQWQQQYKLIGETVQSWQTHMAVSAEALVDQSTAMREQGAAMIRLIQETGELSRLEERLVENLQAVRVAESLEETLLNLNAAINLLTARQQHSKAA